MAEILKRAANWHAFPWRRAFDTRRWPGREIKWAWEHPVMTTFLLLDSLCAIAWLVS